LRSLGQILGQWQDEFDKARRIFGLDDLLVGRFPETPPGILEIPYSLDDPRGESLALLIVASETDMDAAASDLMKRLQPIRDKLAWVEDAAFYSFINR
jgi:hypothetical protein